MHEKQANRVQYGFRCSWQDGLDATMLDLLVYKLPFDRFLLLHVTLEHERSPLILRLRVGVTSSSYFRVSSSEMDVFRRFEGGYMMGKYIVISKWSSRLRFCAFSRRVLNYTILCRLEPSWHEGTLVLHHNEEHCMSRTSRACLEERSLYRRTSMLADVTSCARGSFRTQAHNCCVHVQVRCSSRSARSPLRHAASH